MHYSRHSNMNNIKTIEKSITGQNWTLFGTEDPLNGDTVAKLHIHIGVEVQCSIEAEYVLYINVHGP